MVRLHGGASPAPGRHPTMTTDDHTGGDAGTTDDAPTEQPPEADR